MPVRYGLAAAAAACLVGGLAFAETPPSPDASSPPAAGEPAAPADQSQPPAAPADQGQAPAAAPMSAPADQSTAPAATGAESSAQVAQAGTQVVASQPVPDTPDNRAKYGAPLSHAGKHTKPAGN
ncbi:MAG: hypothetical protein JO127_07840 [Caulobacteraceae bacterium]|nr:hypothetical protein [Caulobacteraceae bacterium]